MVLISEFSDWSSFYRARVRVAVVAAQANLDSICKTFKKQLLEIEWYSDST